jgi:hypothetical protein
MRLSGLGFAPQTVLYPGFMKKLLKRTALVLFAITFLVAAAASLDRPTTRAVTIIQTVGETVEHNHSRFVIKPPIEQALRFRAAAAWS